MQKRSEQRPARRTKPPRWSADSPGRAQADGDYDVAVVGSGGAAFGAALRASALGARVVMVERANVGGTCVNVGWVPSKTQLAGAHAPVSC